MLLTVISALIGAFLGMNSRNALTAALVAAALAGTGHFVLLLGSALALAFSAEPEPLFATFTAIGLRGYGLASTMGVGAAAALVAGILLQVEAIRASVRERGDRPHLASPELARVAEVLAAAGDPTEHAVAN
jgi:hypothetical protein